jgi:hypothetical protein
LSTLVGNARSCRAPVEGWYGRDSPIGVIRTSVRRAGVWGTEALMRIRSCADGVVGNVVFVARITDGADGVWLRAVDTDGTLPEGRMGGWVEERHGCPGYE